MYIHIAGLRPLSTQTSYTMPTMGNTSVTVDKCTAQLEMGHQVINLGQVRSQPGANSAKNNTKKLTLNLTKSN